MKDFFAPLIPHPSFLLFSLLFLVIRVGHPKHFFSHPSCLDKMENNVVVVTKYDDDDFFGFFVIVRADERKTREQTTTTKEFV